MKSLKILLNNKYFNNYSMFIINNLNNIFIFLLYKENNFIFLFLKDILYEVQIISYKVYNYYIKLIKIKK